MIFVNNELVPGQNDINKLFYIHFSRTELSLLAKFASFVVIELRGFTRALE
jgi:hypothetical protein